MEEKLIIKGRQPLHGEVSINGAKNAAVAIIPAAILCEGITIIENLPHIEDVYSLIGALNSIGCRCEFIDRHTLKIDATSINSYAVNYDTVKKMRASYYLLGALLGRFKKAEVALPGGCDFGSRPIDLHLKGFRLLGAEAEIDHGMVKCHADKLIGSSIYLDKVSVGSTINIMLAAVLADGVTTIENAAKEPHVVDTANFLNILGANVKGAGTDVIKITGVPKLHGGQYTIIPDQIEAGTYMIAAASAKGDVKVCNIIPKHMESLTAKLIEMGVGIIVGDDYIRIKTDFPLKSTNIQTMVYPGFPTDLQPQMCSLLAVAEGVSVVTETVFDNRFQYVDELKRLGAKISAEGRVAIIEGNMRLTGAEVKATDLRAGAAMVIAGLCAEGETIIDNVKFIDRGYEDIVDKLKSLGAKISRVKMTPPPRQKGKLSVI